MGSCISYQVRQVTKVYINFRWGLPDSKNSGGGWNEAGGSRSRKSGGGSNPLCVSDRFHRNYRDHALSPNQHFVSYKLTFPRIIVAYRTHFLFRFFLRCCDLNFFLLIINFTNIKLFLCFLEEQKRYSKFLIKNVGSTQLESSPFRKFKHVQAVWLEPIFTRK